MAKKTSELDNDVKEKLARAYMSLYDALVKKYQSQHLTLGKSWYKALIEIHSILEAQESGQSNQAINYLMNFYNEHRKTQTKKMMTDAQKDSVIDVSESNGTDVTENLSMEIKHFQETLHSVAGDNLHSVLINSMPINSKISGKGFYEWLNMQPENQSVDLENDPRSFERAYRKFIFQQKWRRNK